MAYQYIEQGVDHKMLESTPGLIVGFCLYRETCKTAFKIGGVLLLWGLMQIFRRLFVSIRDDDVDSLDLSLATLGQHWIRLGVERTSIVPTLLVQLSFLHCVF